MNLMVERDRVAIYARRSGDARAQVKKPLSSEAAWVLFPLFVQVHEREEKRKDSRMLMLWSQGMFYHILPIYAEEIRKEKRTGQTTFFFLSG